MLGKALFAILIFVILVVGMANPQLGTKKEKMQGKGVDCMILLDVSNSMMAQDIQPNRSERAKLFITKLLDKLQNDRVGLIIFAGEAYVQVPLTIDYSAIKMTMPFVSPASITSQGTSIGEAVALAEETLGNKDIQNKAIVVITDGEDHEKEAEEAIASAKKKGIKTFSIGVGEEQGAPIPMGNGENKKDEQGNEIKTAFNRKMLEELASIGNGSFYHLGQQSDIEDEVAHSIQEIEGKNFEEFFFSSYESYFYYFLIAVLLLVIIDFFMPEGTWHSLYRRQTMFLLCMVLIGNSAFGQDQIKDHKEELNKKIRQGNKNYETKNLPKAEIEYRKALQLSPKSQVANYNLGNSLYEQNKFQESKEYFAKSASLASDKMTKAKSYHNLGNALYKNNETDEAIKAYENALKLNPQDMDTKYNLALAKRKKKNNGGGGSKNQNQQNQQNK
jgi:Ca-activated chloride channel family protein